jgi:hypothetical protein
MAQKILYPLNAICKDIEAQFATSESEEGKKVCEAAKFIIELLQKSKTSV